MLLQKILFAYFLNLATFRKVFLGGQFQSKVDFQYKKRDKSTVPSKENLSCKNHHLTFTQRGID